MVFKVSWEKVHIGRMFDTALELLKIKDEIAFGLLSVSIQDQYLHITTLEGRFMTIELTTQGFRVVQDSTVYESIQSLLFELSPLFKSRFHAELFNKLSEMNETE
jgi:hypothetical protein